MGKILGEKGSIFVALKNMLTASCSEVGNVNSPKLSALGTGDPGDSGLGTGYLILDK